MLVRGVAVEVEHDRRGPGAGVGVVRRVARRGRSRRVVVGSSPKGADYLTNEYTSTNILDLHL